MDSVDEKAGKVIIKSCFFLVCVIGMAFVSACAKSPSEGRLDSFLGQPKLEIQHVFEGERFPSVVVTNKGTVLAVWGWHHQGVSEEECCQKYVLARRSEDGGKTWGAQIEIGKGLNTGGATVDETTGNIFVFIEDKHPPQETLFVFISKDDGKTWSPWDVVIKPDENGVVPSMTISEAGITLRNSPYAGRLLRPARYYAEGNRTSDYPDHYNTAIYSDDGGKTWQTSKPFPEFGTGEGSVVELSDGSVLYDSRVHWDVRPQPTKRRFAWSYDGGHTWQDWRIMDILPDGPQSMVYGLMGGLTRLLVEGRDILLYSNVDVQEAEPFEFEGRRFSGRHCGRRRGTVWVSFDGGQTWPLKRLVYEGPFAYSSMVAGRPGTASQGWVYLFFEGGPKGWHEDGYMARFNLSWLLEGEPTGDGMLPDWITVQ